MAEPNSRVEWPVPWQPVWGDEDGLRARLASGTVRAALAGASRLPEAVLAPLLEVVAGLGGLVDRRRVRAAHVFLRQALGDLGPAELERRTRLAWRHLLRVTVDTQRFQRLIPAERWLEHCDVRWTDDARRVVAEKRGCVFVTAHVGNWEAGIALMPWIGFHPVYAVARPPKNRPLSMAMQQERERRGIRMLPRKGAMRAAPQILRAGGAIGLVLDHRTSGRSFLCPFFGRLARCDRSAGVLLRRQRVPVLVACCTMGAEPLTYRIDFQEVLWPEEWAGRELQDIVLRINQALERMILAHPDQYFWLHDRYRNTPEQQEIGRARRPLPPPSVPEIANPTPSREP